jgi:hypothetical protein
VILGRLVTLSRGLLMDKTYLFLLLLAASVTLENSKRPKKHKFAEAPWFQRFPFLHPLLEIHQCILSSFLVDCSIGFLKHTLDDVHSV